MFQFQKERTICDCYEYNVILKYFKEQIQFNYCHLFKRISFITKKSFFFSFEYAN